MIDFLRYQFSVFDPKIDGSRYVLVLGFNSAKAEATAFQTPLDTQDIRGDFNL